MVPQTIFHFIFLHQIQFFIYFDHHRISLCKIHELTAQKLPFFSISYQIMTLIHHFLKYIKA